MQDTKEFYNNNARARPPSELNRIFAIIFYAIFLLMSVLFSGENITQHAAVAYIPIFVMDVIVYGVAIFAAARYSLYLETYALYVGIIIEAANFVPLSLLVFYQTPVFLLVRSYVIEALNLTWLVYRLMSIRWLRFEVNRGLQKGGEANG